MMGAEEYTCAVQDNLFKYPKVEIQDIKRIGDEISIAGSATQTTGGWKLAQIKVMDGCPEGGTGQTSTSASGYTGRYLAGDSNCTLVENSRMSMVGLVFVIIPIMALLAGYLFVPERVRRNSGKSDKASRQR